MPSDERVQRALDALGERRGGFRAAVETAYAQARGFLAAHGPSSDERAREMALELGPFAGGRVDAARFGALVTASRVLSPEEETIVRRCAEVMDEVLAQGDGLFVCDVPAGGDLRSVVDATLAEAGRAFGAALVFQAVKAGSYRAEQHVTALRAFPYRRWSRGERLLAPPLVVSVDGADLHAGVLAEYLDGQQKIVVVVRGAATPAPLVRLVAPRAYVAQLSDTDSLGADVLARAASFDGPAVAALVPESAARFVHDPAAGLTLAKRLSVVAMPKEPPRGVLGGHSVAQQREELAQLVELADFALLTAARAAASGAAEPAVTAPPAPGPATSAVSSAVPSAVSNAASNGAPPAVAAPTAVDDGAAVSALTAWLLSQAGLPAPGGAVAAAGGGGRP